MASVFDNIRKRSAFPVPELEDVYIRDLTYSETRRVRALSGDDERSAFVMGLSVVDGSGNREWTPIEGESDAAFAARVMVAIDELTPLVIQLISEAIEGLMKPVDVEKLQKKSLAITSPDSPVT